MEDRHHDPGLPVRAGALGKAVPDSVRRAFPGLEQASEQDRAVVAAQLGRSYQGEIFVSRRCPHGCPAVVLTLPLEGLGGPVPPMLWLTCPRASSMVGRLESSGEMKAIKESLAADSGTHDEFLAEERRFAVLQEDLARAAGGDELARRLAARGVAGGRVGSIKCLHAHLAYRLSLQTDAGLPECGRVTSEGRALLGERCERLLEEEGGVWCERPPAACVT